MGRKKSLSGPNANNERADVTKEHFDEKAFDLIHCLFHA
jgi:hypothetical protein